LWQHLPVLGLVILACMPVGAVVVAVCQLLNKDYYYYYYYYYYYNYLNEYWSTLVGTECVSV